MSVRKLGPLLIIAAALLAYQNSLTGPFIYDDRRSITDNPTIRHLWPIWQALSPPHRGGITVEGRPIINFSLAINCALGGFNVWGYHALNLTIHILAGLTLLGIVRRTLLQPWLRGRFGAAADVLGAVIAILWTVHPLQTASVTYVIQRAESLMGLFYLLTLYCFIRGAQSPRPRPWYDLSVAACALGMASKEAMASAPLVVMLYDRTFLSGSFREAWRRRWPLFIGLAATWVILGYLVIVTIGNAWTNAERSGVTWWQYLAIEPAVILHYLRLSAWPHPLCFDYDGWVVTGAWMTILFPALVMVILLGATAWAWKVNSAWGFLGGWFFLILAPSSSVIPLDSPAYEHRMYLPLAAVIAAIVVGGFVLGSNLLVARPQTRKMLGCAVSLALVWPLAILTIQRNHTYNSARTIWEDTVRQRPGNSRAHYNLATALEEAGQIDEAIGHYEQALRLNPDFAEAHYNLGVAVGRLGQVQEARRHYEQALRLNPDFVEAHNNLAVALEQAGRGQEACRHYEQALRIKPDSAELHNNLGGALLRLGKLQEAIQHYEQALQVKPDYAELHYNLAVALEQAGRVQEASRHYERALQIRPGFAEARNKLDRLRTDQ